MATYPDAENPIAEQHTCPHCGKHFVRPCDLNKHAKSHSRPFKCEYQNCKYRQLGWPTAKELERHVNDKHTAAPRTYPCLFQPCPYRSKRESNCKQHMEKAHSWTYVRSKFNGKRRSDQSLNEPLALPSATGSTPYPTPSSFNHLQPQPSADADFVLYSDDEADPSATLEDDDNQQVFLPTGPGSHEPKSFLPWTSPMTRQRNNQNFLDHFGQMFNALPEKSEDGHDNLIDPMLSFMADTPHPDSPESVAETTVKLEFTPKSELSPFPPRKRGPGGYPFTSEEPSPKKMKNVALPVTAPAEESSRPSGADEPTLRLVSSPGVGQLQAVHPKLTHERQDNDDDDELQPPKKTKPTPSEEFTDKDMPDIFRYAHPQIYDRDNSDRFSPCHSRHKDISTLVRHLSRPAHRLTVTERSISSFEVDEPEYSHPRVGLCRRCWVAFGNRQAFEAHLASNCDKVSKGKREKWHILLECFTPTVDATTPTATPRLAEATLPHRVTKSEISSHEPMDISPTDDQTIILDPPSPPVSAPSPATIDLSLRSSIRPYVEGEWVPMSEHRRLQEELQTLKCLATALVVRQTQIESSGPIHVPTSVLLGLPATSNIVGHQNLLTGTVPAALAGSPAVGVAEAAVQEIPPDRESLVGHMDSQSTDVDPQGLMDEAQTLSRANSGISSDRSTVRHVPTSPPPRYERLPDGSMGPVLNDGTKASSRSAPPSRHPPTSLPDSGYGTDPKRASLGQEELGEQLKLVGNTADPNAAKSQHRREQDLSVSHMTERGVEHAKTDVAREEPVLNDMMWGSFQNPFVTSSDQPEDNASHELNEYLYNLNDEALRSPNAFDIENHAFPLDPGV